MAEHTKGRLHVRSDKRMIELIAEGSIRIARTESNSPEDQANARRLVTCWNACEGISTELLEEETRLIDAMKTESPVA